jgi:hypothetical protein
VNEYLLVGLESLHIDTASVSVAHRSLQWLTHVFNPDSVEALTPKKYESMAERLP